MKIVSKADAAVVIITAAVVAGPAMAGQPAAPTPLVGAGIGAIVAMGAGYRLLKRKIDR